MNGGVTRARWVGHDLEQIEVIAHTVSSQQQGSISVKFQGHYSFVVSYKVRHNTVKLVHRRQTDLILIRVGAYLKNVQDGDDALLHIIGSIAKVTATR